MGYITTRSKKIIKFMKIYMAGTPGNHERDLKIWTISFMVLFLHKNRKQENGNEE